MERKDQISGSWPPSTERNENMNRRKYRFFALLLTALLSAGILSGCTAKLDELTDKAINAVGSSVSDAMEDVDVKQTLSGFSDKLGNLLDGMPETNSALKDAVSSITSSIANDVSGSSSTSDDTGSSEIAETQASAEVTEDGSYTSKDEVAVYLHTYGKLPSNYMTTEAAKALGWDGESDLWAIQSGISIGGDEYGNHAGLLPSADGRSWKQCDIGYNGGTRGPERLVYSSDGLIYYSPDRFTTFEEIVF